MAAESTASPSIETLDKLERRVTLTIPLAEVQAAVSAKLRELSRTVRADGFRPGKVPLSFVAQRYGASVNQEVVGERVGRAFEAVARDAKLRVAGPPTVAVKDGAAEGQLTFDATFEVFPEVKLGELAGVEVERIDSEVDDPAIDRTLDILRKQRRTFGQRPADAGAAEDDRVTIDFEGKVDGEPFDGGRAEGFQFVVGEGQMLADFDRAVRGMKVGESKTFPLKFPDDYHGKDVAGKEADFLVTMKKIEAQQLPEIDEAFVKSLGIDGATLDALRDDVRKNLEREVARKVRSINRAAALAAIDRVAELDVPKALVEQEIERRVAGLREQLKRQGMKNVEQLPIDGQMFREQAERQVKLGLAASHLVQQHGLQPKPEQLRAHIEELAQSFEKPAEVVRWYLSDRQRMAGVENEVIEQNIAEHVMAHAKVSDRRVPFDELMKAGAGGAA